MWEDWKAGMWGASKDEESDLRKAVEFTGDWARYGKAMREVVMAWPHTMRNSLTNLSINRRAFLGHCAVCYKLAIPEYITRMAWKMLTNEQRRRADMEAQNTIDEYTRKNRPVREDMGGQMLLEFARRCA